MQNSKQDRRVRYTKKVLRESLITLMKEKPISKITIKEICDLADINRGTFYAHYSDQHNLLWHIEQDLLRGILEYLAGFSMRDTDHRAETLQIMEYIFNYIESNGELCKVLLSPNGNITFLQEVMSVVQTQCLKDWSRLRDASNTEYLYAYIITGSVGLVQKWIHDDFDKSASTMANLVMQLTNYGLSSFA